MDFFRRKARVLWKRLKRVAQSSARKIEAALPEVDLLTDHDRVSWNHFKCVVQISFKKIAAALPAIDLSTNRARVVIAIIGIVVTIIGLTADVFGLIPVMRPLLSGERPMTGEFNVAVSEFIVVDESGKQVDGEDGRGLSDFLYGRLQIRFDEFDLSVPYELRPPEQVGRVEGSTRNERAIAAAELAAEINANVVIYGVVYQDEFLPRLEPEFHVDYRGFEQAQEITGPHKFGRAVQVDLPFQASQFQGIANPTLNARSQALALLTLGLAYHSTGDLKRALNFYEEADSVEGLSRRDGKETLLLLIGNVHSVLASQSRCDVAMAEQHRETAADYYDMSLGIDPNYARALLGKAGTLYLRALGDPNLPSMDAEMLERSATLFEQALSTENQPPSANIQPKVNFNLGQIELLRLVGSGQPLDTVGARFKALIDEYEAGNTALEELAAHSYARLGLIERLRGQSDASIELYGRAIEIISNYSPYFKTDYRVRQGRLYIDAGNLAMADQMCTDAWNLALDIEEPKLVGLALSCLATSADRSGQGKRAQELYQQAIDATAGDCPADAASYRADLAHLYKEAGRFEQAAEEYQRAIDLAYAPLLEARYYAQLGDFHASTGNRTDALQAYDQAVRLASEADNREHKAEYEARRAALQKE